MERSTKRSDNDLNLNLLYGAASGTTGPHAPPSRAFPDDAGFDLMVSRTLTVEPGCFAQIPTGLAVSLPPGHWGLLLGRSSASHQKAVVVLPGVVDPGYRGEIMASVYNPTGKPVTVKAGERLFQLIPIRIAAMTPEFCSPLPPGDRGGRGFGSTGGYTSTA